MQKRYVMNTQTEHRRINVIAREIVKDWGPKMYFGAKPYVNAMLTLGTIEDKYGFDDGKSIVLYFLANASSWRGETARRIKAELKQICEVKG